jgi:hypothetical protein
MAVMKVKGKNWKDVECDKAVKVKLCQLFEELCALQVVRKAEIDKKKKILKSNMFIVQKHHANGDFDKVKARLVADGRDQDPKLYPNKSSSMVAIHSVFTVLGLAMVKKWRFMVKIDIKRAFVQTPMVGELMFMKLDKKVTGYMMELYLDLKVGVKQDGCLNVKLLKVVYGCVQASALWYTLIKGTLENMGYQTIETAVCVFRKQPGEQVFLLLLYIDDILAVVDEQESEKLKKHMEEKFGEVKLE